MESELLYYLRYLNENSTQETDRSHFIPVQLYVCSAFAIEWKGQTKMMRPIRLSHSKTSFTYDEIIYV